MSITKYIFRWLKQLLIVVTYTSLKKKKVFYFEIQISILKPQTVYNIKL